MVDSTFLSSNSLKIPSGGWLPVVVGTVLFLVISIWIKGRALLLEYLEEKRVLFEDLEEKIKGELVRVKGTAIYLARSLHGVPQVFLHNLTHNHVLHERISFRNKSAMPKWRRPLFRFLFHNSSSAIEFFKTPVDQVVELGIRIEL